VTAVALTAFAPTLDLGERIKLRNPIGLTGVPKPEQSALGAVLVGLLPVCTAAAVVSLVLRFRRSHGVERQQLKWFTYAGVLGFSWSVADLVLPDVAPFNVFSGLTIALVPVAAGIAVLRYRLYDIDRLINRTPGLWAAHRPTRQHLHWRGPDPGPGVRPGGEGSAELGGGRRDPDGGRLVPAGSPAHPSGR
jgi:hypothetical protein